jgi:hypothetical protein
MSNEATSTKIIYAPTLIGKMIKYMTELTVEQLDNSRFLLTRFGMKEYDDKNIIFHEFGYALGDDELISSKYNIPPSLTEKSKSVKPTSRGSLDVYTIKLNTFNGKTINIPSELIYEVVEKFPELEIKKERRGRPKRYNNDEERKLVQQKHALLYHYRKEALNNYLKTNPNDDFITVEVKIESKVLGTVNETIKYKRLNDGSYRKMQ